MPEFEETQSNADSAQTYSPGDEAKPKTRRRSGGFKKEYTTAPQGNMGEIDPTEAFQTEALSGAHEPEAQVEPTPAKEQPPVNEESAETRQPQRRPAREETPRGNPQPSEATLAAVKQVEERIAKRKAERDARHEARKKNASERPAAKATNKPAQRGKKNAPAKGGLIASILKLFGLGPKPAKKTNNQSRSGNRGNRRDGPRNEGGQGRRPRGGQGRRRGGRGRGGDRRQSSQSRDNS
jgi:hypothetical protein